VTSAARRLARAALAWSRAAARAARLVLGVPDNERYLAHMRAHHAAETPLSRDEHLRERLHQRYNRPGSRCC
jgi:uncharacterized short protein YbdD (DUF466 family)